MAQDVRVILIKLADRMHNMRTIEYQTKQKQAQKARETLEVYAPLAHRLGIHKLKWELEDLSFQTLHPRKYAEIKAMVADQRADREAQADKAATILARELDDADVPAEISARAKHFYSIYDKMAKRGREFNEIYDLIAMRVTCERSDEEGTRDCYAALGLVHSLWKPMPGRFKDFIAMPKLNRYRSLHTTVIGPEGRPLEIQVRTREMHEEAEYGVAAHWLYKHGRREGRRRVAHVGEVAHGLAAGGSGPARVHAHAPHRPLLGRGVRLHAEGRGEGAAVGRDADRLRVRGAHGRRPPNGWSKGQRSHRSAALPADERGLRRDPHLEVRARPLARLAHARALLTGPQQDPAVVPARDARRDGGEGPRAPRPGAEGAEAPVPEDPGLERARAGDPRDRLQEGGGLLRRARRREAPARPDRQQGHPAAQDRRGRLRARDHDEAGEGEDRGLQLEARDHGAGRRGRARPAREVLHAGAGRPDRRLHLARSRHHGAPRATART